MSQLPQIGISLVGPPGWERYILRPLVRLQGMVLFRHTRSLTLQRHLLDMLRFLPAWGVQRRSVRLGRLCGEWLLPRGATPNAAVLYLHGGGYCMGSPATHRGMTACIARQTGIRTFALDYRLAPEHPFPAALEDVLDAIAELRRLAGPGLVLALAGDSAGGGLALAATAVLRDRGAPLPAAVVALSPWTDLTCSGESFMTRRSRDLLLLPAYVRSVANMYLLKHRPDSPLASPLFASLEGFPPLLLQVGEDEILLDDSVRFAQRALAANVATSLEIWQGMWHVWQIVGPFLPEAMRALGRVNAFLRYRIETERRGYDTQQPTHESAN